MLLKEKMHEKHFCKHIDNVISASYGPDLSITHRCIDSEENEQLKIGTADDEQICFYDMTRCYKKGISAFRNIQGGVKTYKFKETHPGHKFSHLIQLKFPCIPRIALPKGKLCPLNELDLKCTNPPQCGW